MSKEISKSPEMLQKEATIQSLQKEIKKTRTTLKSLKTRLGNTQQEITDIQMKVSSQYFRLMEDLDNLKQDIIGILKKLIKMKNLIPEERRQMKMMAEEMEAESFGEDFEEYRRQKAKMENGEFDFEENQRAKIRDMFAEFRVKPNEKEQRDIRKVFIKLSTHFHPDKAKNQKEEDFFHSLMQEINEAYQQGDIDRLLEIERLNLEMESVDFQSKSVTVDMLQQAINRLTKELDYLKNQIKRTSLEIKQLRKSDLGKMLTGINKAEREGEGMDEMLQEMENSKSELTNLRDNLAAAEEKGDLSEFYQKMASQMPTNPFEDFDMEEDGMEGMADVMDLFSEMFGEEDEDDDYESMDNPKFEIGSSVVVKEEVFNNLFPKTNMKGWVGRVKEAFISNGEEWYTLDFDSITIEQQMSSSFIKTILNLDEDFAAYDFAPHQLEASAHRDTVTDMMIAYRTSYHQHYWEDLSLEQKKLMIEIMTQLPEKSENENWTHYLENNLVFPFKATSIGLFQLKKGTTYTIKSLDEWNIHAAQLVNIRSGFNTQEHPLLDLETTGENQPILDLYALWATDLLS